MEKIIFENFLFFHVFVHLPRKARPAFGSWVCRTLAVRVRPISTTIQFHTTMAQTTSLRATSANNNRVSVSFNGKTYYRSAEQEEGSLHFAEKPIAFFPLNDVAQRAKYLGTFVRALLPKGVEEGNEIAVLVFDKEGEQILLTAGKNRLITDLKHPHVQVIEVFDPTKSQTSVGYWVVEGRKAITDSDELTNILGTIQ